MTGFGGIPLGGGPFGAGLGVDVPLVTPLRTFSLRPTERVYVEVSGAAAVWVMVKLAGQPRQMDIVWDGAAFRPPYDQNSKRTANDDVQCFSILPNMGRWAAAPEITVRAFSPSGIEGVLGPFREVGNLFTLQRTIITNAPTDRVALGSIDGEIAREVLLRYWIVQDEAPTGRDVKVYPNSIKGSAASAIMNQTGVTVSQATRDNLCIAFNTTRERVSGYLRLQSELQPGGTPTNFNRRFEGFTTVGDGTITELSSGFHRANGWWAHGDGALSSLDIVTTGNDDDILQPAIGTGSVFELWYLNATCD